MASSSSPTPIQIECHDGVNGSARRSSLSRNRTLQVCTTPEQRLDELRKRMGKADGEPLRVVGIGAGAWGCVFTAMIQETYGEFKDKMDVRIWRRGGRTLDKSLAQSLFNVINNKEDVLRRLIRNCAYLKYVEARLGDRTLFADEILRDGFCVNLADTPLCPLNVVTNLQEAVWDADVIINGLPSTETRGVFRQIGLYWRERRKPPPVIISLAKGVEAALLPEPHIVTPTLMIHQETGVPTDNILYLGGPNIASEIYNREYANARLCGSECWRAPVAAFLRQRNFIVWGHRDLVTHEVMGGLKNVYAIGAGLVAGLTNESATSKSVYFAHSTSEMIFVTRLIAKEPERLAGPLLADTYVTLLKGRNAWYGHELATGALTPEMGDVVPGKGLIQGVSAVEAFFTVLSQPVFQVPHPLTNELVAPIELCPILQTLHHILHVRDCSVDGILDTLRDENMYDPAERIATAPERCYMSQLLDRHPSSTELHDAATAAVGSVGHILPK